MWCPGPSLLDEEGFCPAHRPGGRETMAERGRKGGLATKRKAATAARQSIEQSPDNLEVQIMLLAALTAQSDHHLPFPRTSAGPQYSPGETSAPERSRHGVDRHTQDGETIVFACYP